jgi:hypothetical protein
VLGTRLEKTTINAAALASNITVNLPTNTSTLSTLDLTETITGEKTYTNQTNYNGRIIMTQNLFNQQAFQILSSNNTA